MVEKNEEGSGGAQYLMKGVTAEYWKEVKEDSLMLYKYMSDRENEERKSLSAEELKTYNPIQKWCADMWSVLWGAWKMGAQTIVTPDLDFSWGTSSIADYNRCNIMHNAGVTGERADTLFYKANFRDSSPFDADLSFVTPDTASAKYVEAILYAREKRG